MIVSIIEKIFIISLTIITISFFVANLYCGKKMVEYSQKGQSELIHNYLMIQPVCTACLAGSGGFNAICVMNFWNKPSIFLCIILGLFVSCFATALIIVCRLLSRQAHNTID